MRDEKRLLKERFTTYFWGKMVEFGSLLEISAWDFVLLSILAVLVYRWWKRQNTPDVERPVVPKIPPTEMMDLTIEELLKYNGTTDPHIFFALNGTIFDVTRGANFYGPDGPYGALAGHDATRSLATMDTKAVKTEWDNCDDLTPSERDSANEWEASFKFKYPTVGKLVKSQEEKKDYEGKIAGINM
ncbi:unnamed protein product, partial [Mesorhabditis belari]|uniref:Cytochrome b5 heme-binding domain-containing protein n=1 Tax=Mesorhabditis belari TaxID=2138241 RepID=A0AAF3E8K1_9BILA